MIKEANRISIIGGCGTGKTTLSKNLGNELKLPVYHLDGIAHFENWKRRKKEERDQIILEKVKQKRWIIDGTYHATLQQRLEKADVVIYLDYSSIAQIKGILGRYIKQHGKEKDEIPGCKERFTWKFFFWTLNWRKNKRNQILEQLSKIDEKKLIIFKNRRKLNKWYRENFLIKIKKY